MGFNGDLYQESGATSVLSTKGDIVRYNTERERYGIGSAGQVLQVASSLPTWSTINLADSVLTTQGDVLYEGASDLARLGQSTNNYTLATKGSGANPAWQASSTSVLTTTGDLLYASGANTLARLAGGTSGDILTANGAGVAPSYQTPAGGSNSAIPRWRLPLEGTDDAVSIGDLFRIGAKNWKVSQATAPIQFTDENDDDVVAFSDSFSGYADDTAFDNIWNTDDATNVNLSASGNKIIVTCPTSDADARCYYDLGHVLEDTSTFVLGFTFQNTTFGDGNKKCIIGMSNTTGKPDTNMDLIGFNFSNTGSYPYTFGTQNNQTMWNSDGGEMSVSADTSVHRFILMGLGYGNFRGIMYEASNGSITQPPVNKTREESGGVVGFSWNSGIDALRYLKIGSATLTSGSTAMVSEFTDIFFAESDQTSLLN